MFQGKYCKRFLFTKRVKMFLVVLRHCSVTHASWRVQVLLWPKQLPAVKLFPLLFALFEGCTRAKMEIAAILFPGVRCSLDGGAAEGSAPSTRGRNWVVSVQLHFLLAVACAYSEAAVPGVCAAAAAICAALAAMQGCAQGLRVLLWDKPISAWDREVKVVARGSFVAVEIWSLIPWWQTRHKKCYFSGNQIQSGKHSFYEQYGRRDISGDFVSIWWQLK